MSTVSSRNRGAGRRFGESFVAVIALTILLAGSLPAEAAVKGQYISKMYTEALGRIPDQGGWLNAINLFASGCSASVIRSFGVGVYTSTEFTNLPYDNASRLLALYRGALNREPYSTEYNNNLTLLNTGTSWTTMVNTLFNSSEFNNKAGSWCSTTNYLFGTNFPIAIPTSGSGFIGNQDQLQAAIDATPSGGTVWLAQKSVVGIYKPLILKSGVTLATTGNPPATQYAKMARLVRTNRFNDAMVRMLGGSKVKSVWIDGQRSFLGFSFEDVNVQIWGGTGTEVSSSRMGNTSGGTNLKALGTGEGKPCGSNVIKNNLIDAYTSSHSNSQWADGLTIACENTTVENNEIVDASDVPIVVFGAPPANQASIVRNNRILNVGNSSYGGLGFDGWHSRGVTVGFNGARIENNLIWSGPSVHYDIALAVGTRPWFGNNSDRGTGAAMVNNTSGISKINVDAGIVVSGMMNATVTGNTLDLTILNVSSCPTGAINAAISAGWASGTIQGPYNNVDVSSCVSH